MLKFFPAEGGSIINISSIASQNTIPILSLYSSTNAAVDTLSLALARAWSPEYSGQHRRFVPTETEGLHNWKRQRQIAGSRHTIWKPFRPTGKYIAPVVVFASDESVIDGRTHQRIRRNIPRNKGQYQRF